VLICVFDIRWHNHLNPGIKKTPWTAEEDAILIEQHKIHGNKWAAIAKALPGRYVSTSTTPPTPTTNHPNTSADDTDDSW
jgi:hypothetical protein